MERLTRETNDAMPLRSDVHPRLRVNWRATGTAVAAFIAGLSVGCIVAASLVVMAVQDHSLKMEPYSLPPCATEDSVGCYWDAETMGNGSGVDVVVIPSAPRCTDQIADAGGTCWGEPE